MYYSKSIDLTMFILYDKITFKIYMWMVYSSSPQMHRRWQAYNSAQNYDNNYLFLQVEEITIKKKGLLLLSWDIRISLIDYLFPIILLAAYLRVILLEFSESISELALAYMKVQGLHEMTWVSQMVSRLKHKIVFVCNTWNHQL